MKISTISTTQRISAQSRLGGAIACLSIVFFHSCSIADITTSNPYVVYEQLFFHKCLVRWAIPYYFIVAGYWFSQSSYVRGVGVSYWELVIKKCKTILLPYVIFMTLCFLASIPRWAFRGCMDTVLEQMGSVFHFADEFLSVSNALPRFAGHLWFARVLFLLFLLAPIWRFLYRKASTAFLLVGSVIMCVVTRYLAALGIIEIGLYGQASYFFVGLALASAREHDDFDGGMGKRRLVVLALVYVVWSLIEAGCLVHTRGDYSLHVRCWLSHVRVVAQALVPLAGVAVVWQMTRMIADKWPGVANLRVLTWTFLIYCFHGAVCAVTAPALHYLLGYDGWVVLLISSIQFVVMLTSSLMFCRILTTRFPRVADLLSGGRTR